MQSPSRARLAQALLLDQGGRYSEAATLYGEVLAEEPQNADALHGLGVALARSGHVRQALPLLAAAAQVQPANADIHVNLGRALGELGQHDESIPHFDRAIAQRPEFAAAYNGRGVALLRLDRLEEALANLGKAVRLAPNDAAAHSELGVALERAKRLPDALYCFERAVALDPALASAHHNRGLIELTLGRPDAALVSMNRALALQPEHAAVHTNRGHVLLALERGPEALASYDAALVIAPTHADAHHARGLALMHLGRHAEALASFERALALGPATPLALLSRAKALIELARPNEALASVDAALAAEPRNFEAELSRGMALTQLRRYADALACFDRALELNPVSAEAYNNRGAVRVRVGRPADGLADFVQAILLKSDYPVAYINAANTQMGLARYQEALQSFDRALSIAPGDARATWGKGLAKLSLGELREGWPLYESRLRLEQNRAALRSFDAPRWSGAEPIAGKTLLVYADQGLGDTLQFCRYVPLLEARGAKVVLEVQPVLVKLLGSLDMQGTLLGRGEPLPRFDLQVPLVSLPLAFGTELATIPREVPYLGVAQAPVAAWRARLAELSGYKLGLNWQGNVAAEQDASMQARSFPLAAAAPLARLAGFSIVSLQKGAGAEQRTSVEFSAAIHQLTDPGYMGANEIAGETAAILKGLDLVITADTALAHLAGALGVPVWVVLQAVPDWRWLTERSDSPWYPGMRLYRQKTDGDWHEVFERVAADLIAMRG